MKSSFQIEKFNPIKSLKIERFRAIKECKIDGLAKINIFIGRNNSGKSSILEALYLSSAVFNDSDPFNRFATRIEYLLNRRCNRGLRWRGTLAQREVLWHEYDSRRPIEIRINYGDRGINSVGLPIELFEWHEHPLIEIPTDARIHMTERGRIPENFSHLCFHERTMMETASHSAANITESQRDNVMRELIPDFESVQHFLKNMVFVESRLIYEMESVERSLWNDLLKKRLDRLITEVIREGYEIPVEDITYMPYGDKYQLAVKLPKTTVRVDDLGDGARYSMVFLMVAALAHSSAILIEEPENHQHPGGLAKSMEMILDLIERNNVQLFASTHSIEFLRIISQIAKEKKIDLLTFFIEMGKNGVVEARKVSPEDTENLMKMGLDVRFLDAI